MTDATKHATYRALTDAYGPVRAEEFMRDIETGDEVETLAVQFVPACLASWRIGDEQRVVESAFDLARMFIVTRDRNRRAEV